MLRKKCPELTIEQAKVELPDSLNFLEKAQVKSSLPFAITNLRKQSNAMAHEGKKVLHSNINCIKWPKPVYDAKGELRKIGEGRLKDHQSWLQEKFCVTSISSLCSLRSIYWLHISHIIPPPHPFR